ncbi:MAG: hypothetical protein WDM88_06860, partial [Galbitalea sp.]
MKSDDVDEPEAEAADRRDNRVAIIVAGSAAIIVGVASGILMATANSGPQQAAPRPAHSSVEFLAQPPGTD